MQLHRGHAMFDWRTSQCLHIRSDFSLIHSHTNIGTHQLRIQYWSEDCKLIYAHISKKCLQVSTTIQTNCWRIAVAHTLCQNTPITFILTTNRGNGSFWFPNFRLCRELYDLSINMISIPCFQFSTWCNL